MLAAEDRHSQAAWDVEWRLAAYLGENVAETKVYFW
jgi:hypothetical protein